MSSEKLLNKLKEVAKSERDTLESATAPKFATEVISDNSALWDKVKDLADTSEDNSKWEKAHAKDQSTPAAKTSEVQKPRRNVTFKVLFMKEMHRQYCSGSDNHVITDVDVMREGIRAYQNFESEVTHLEAVL